MNVQLHIQQIDVQDFGHLVQLERDTQDDAWTESAFLDLQAQDVLGFGVLGAYQNEQWVGYLAYQCPAVSGVAEILRFGVAQKYQRQGIARRLLTAWIEVMQAQNAERCLLEVRTDNVAAIALYQSAGFTTIALRKNYYVATNQNSSRDAQIMQKQMM